MPPHGQVLGNIVSRAPEPRSYNVNVQSGEVRRNWSHLCERNTTVPEARADVSSSGGEPGRVQTHSQTGVTLQPPYVIRPEHFMISSEGDYYYVM